MGYSMMKLVINKIYWDLRQSYERNCPIKALCLTTLKLRFVSSPSQIATQNIVRIIDRHIYTHEN